MKEKMIRLFICLTLALGIAWGQGSVGTLNGTVLDPTGAVIPGATVVATNNATGVQSTTTTTSAGAFTLPYLPAATYTVRVSSPGFSTAVQENVILRVGQVLTVNITIEVGAVAEEVTVSAAPPLLESGTAEIGRYISTDEYQNWPIMVADGQRQIQSFIFSSLPGTTGGEFEGSINGGQQYSHEILIEGIPVGRSDLSGGNNNEMSPSAEAIGEFKMHTGAMGAQYNGGQTAVANFSYKSGGNDLHGSAFYYGQNEALNATTYADSSRGVEKKAPFRQHNYGYSVGGPIYIPKVYDGRNKAFFFTNFEKTERSSFTIAGLNTTLPTTDFKAGNFSRLFDPGFTGVAESGSVLGEDALGRPVVHGQIYDPTTTSTAPDGSVIRDPFPGNIIPSSRISNVASNIINGVGIVDPDLNTMVRNTAEIGGCCPFFDLYIVGIKSDVNITDKHRVSGLYNHEYRIRNNSPGGRYLPVPGLPTGVFQDQYTPSRMIRMSVNSTLAPNILNRFAGGYNRFRNSNESVYVDEGWAEQVGVQNTAPTHFPRMNFSGNEWQGGLTMQIGSSNAGENMNGSYIFQDDLTYITGAHTLRFGWEHRRYYYKQRSKNGSGNFNFSPIQTHMPGFAQNTGHAFASFLLGAVNSAGRDVYVLTSNHRHPSHGFYVADDWKLSPKLTMNLGFRWEIIQPFREITDRMSMVELGVSNPTAGGLPGAYVFADKFSDTHFGQFGPRIGMAYQVNPKLVVRGGYGITNTPQTRNAWGFGGFTRGFSDSIPINAGTSPTGFSDDPAHWLDNPYPALERTLPNTDPGQGLFTTAQTNRPDSNKLPYVQNWNFTIQYQLPAEFVVEAAYIGNKGTHLMFDPAGELNVLPLQFLQLGDMLVDQVGNHPELKPYASYPNGQSVAQALRPFPQYNSVNEAYAYFGNSNYHSMQTTVRRQFSSGLGILAAYTWSKAMSDYGFGRDDGGSMQDWFNRGLERSLERYHIPHVFRLTWLYELPVGRGKRFDMNGPLNYIIGGWTLSAIHEYRSGGVIGISQSGLRGVAGIGSMRPDRLSAPETVGDIPEVLDFFQGAPYLNPNGWAALVDQPGATTNLNIPTRVGSASRYEPGVLGPKSSSENFRMTKTFPIYETLEFEFGFAATNILNRQGRGIISTNITSPQFGQVRYNGGGQRSIQLEGRITW